MVLDSSLPQLLTIYLCKSDGSPCSWFVSRGFQLSRVDNPPSPTASRKQWDLCSTGNQKEAAREMPSDQRLGSNNGSLLSTGQSYLICWALEGEGCWTISSKVDLPVRYGLLVTAGTAEYSQGRGAKKVWINTSHSSLSTMRGRM